MTSPSETHGPTAAPRRGAMWRRFALAAAGTALATAVAVVTLGGGGDAAQELTVLAPAGPASRAETPDGVEVAADVVRRAIDPSVPLEQRAALFETDGRDQPSAEEVLRSFDGLAEKAGADLDGVTVSARRAGSEFVVVDVHVELDGSIGTRSTLRTVVVHRAGGDWLITRESLCGLASAAAMVGPAARCEQAPAIRHHRGEVDAVTMLTTTAGDPIDAAGARLGYWTDHTVHLGGDLWFADYPELGVGGGGPSGPAVLVRVDRRTGAETARVSVPGVVDSLVGDRGVLWVLHSTYDPVDGSLRSGLTRIDARSGQVTGGTPMDAGVFSLRAAGSEVWVLDGMQVHRYSGAQPRRTHSVGVGAVYDASAAATVGDELWVRRADGTVVAVERNTLVTREVDVPGGTLVGSGDRVWVVEPGPDGTTALLLDRDGGVLATARIGLSTDGYGWGDGEGGLWLAGSGIASSPTAGGDPGVLIDVVARPHAVHVGPDGELTDTWWAVEAGSDHLRFAPAGDGLGYSDGGGLTMLPG